MDEATWIAALDERGDYATRAAFRDWLQEGGDPRWEPLAAIMGAFPDRYPPAGEWMNRVAYHASTSREFSFSLFDADTKAFVRLMRIAFRNVWLLATPAEREGYSSGVTK